MKEPFIMIQTINQEVSVNSIYFTGSDLKTFPREIEVGGQAIIFANGLRYLIQRGAIALQLFDMQGEDGRIYRLSRSGDRWTLVATRGAAL